MAETIDKIIAIVGYLLAIFIPILRSILPKTCQIYYNRCNSYMGYRRFISCYGHAGLKQPLIKI